jgi:DNA-binding NtrC family response regulator
LYYRLNVVTVRLAPLRERKEDIPELIEHFLARCSTGHKLTPECLDAMLSYDWPGNVRELENCIQHMVAIHTGPLLHVGDLPSAIVNHIRQTKAQAAAAAVGLSSEPLFVERRPVTSAGMGGTFSMQHPIMPLMEMERRAIMQALEYTQGDRAIAANLLGIGRTTLYRKLKEYQLAG